MALHCLTLSASVLQVLLATCVMFLLDGCGLDSTSLVSLHAIVSLGKTLHLTLICDAVTAVVEC